MPLFEGFGGSMSEENSQPSIRPLRLTKEGRRLPLSATGGNGYLRADSAPLIGAGNDLEAVTYWLMERGSQSQGTKTSYFLHVERFLLWVSESKGKCLSDLTANDISEYREFLKDPQPESIWCGPRAPRGSNRWRPFKGPLSPASQQLSLNVISSLLNFLVAAGYLRANPMVLMRKPPRSHSTHARPVERYLDETLLLTMADTLDLMPCTSVEEQHKAERMRWVFTLLTTLGLRRDEVCAHVHGDFERRHRPSGYQWWCRIVGKGNRLRVIPVPEACIRGLVRYRRQLGLSDYPTAEDRTPLVCQTAKPVSVSDTTLYRIVKQLCEKTAERIESEDPDGATRLRQASPHWLRHSQITSQGNLGVSMRHRNKSAGHASIETTARYDHANDDTWHSDMQRTPLDAWLTP